jgi:hypothetical protein
MVMRKPTQAVRYFALQALLVAVLLALSYRLLPSDWREGVASLPRALAADLKAAVKGQPHDAAQTLWRALVDDPVVMPWLALSFALGTGLALATHAVLQGPRQPGRYLCAAAVALTLPALVWIVAPVPVALIPVCVLLPLAAQLVAWAVLVATPGNQLHDVHENARWLDGLKAPYNALEHLGSDVFVGLRPGRGGRMLPVTLPVQVLHKNHVALIGASGVGKSKLAALILQQLNAAGDALAVFDPKDDEFLAGILHAGAVKIGVPFVYINLREQVPQVNPFAGCSEEESLLLLQAALGLDPTGDPAVDYHRGNDREACGLLVAAGGTHMIEHLAGVAKVPAVARATNFRRELEQLGWVKAFHCTSGPDMAATLAAGGVVYIVGDTDDLRIVAAQKLLLARVTQIIKARPRAGARQVALMLDEYKYMLSNAALRALGTIRDKRCNLLLAFQSHGDLADCGSLNPIAVRGAADNCTLNFIYKLQDRRTAEDFVKMAGDERVELESIDRQEAERGTRHEANRQAVSIDMLTTNAPKPLSAQECSVSWVFGLGPAFPLSTSHLPAGPLPALKPQPGVAGAAAVAAPIAAQALLPAALPTAAPVSAAVTPPASAGPVQQPQTAPASRPDDEPPAWLDEPNDSLGTPI